MRFMRIDTPRIASYPSNSNARLRALVLTSLRLGKASTINDVRYLVTAKLKPGHAEPLARAIDDGTLGLGSVAGDEYLRNMEAARELEDGRVQWVEVCFCATPLAEEREY